MNPFFLLTVAVAISMLVIPLAWRFAPRLGLVDVPDARKVHAVPVARVGGWGITLGALAPLLLVYKLDALLQSFILANLVLFLFGVWDDAKQTNHWIKFAGQFAAAGIMVFYGGLYVTRLPFLDNLTLSAAMGRSFTLVALVGLINAMNHSDGLDGLAGGETLLTLIALAILGFLVDDTLLPGISLALIGGILGFLRYNSYPARVFMGDGGSQVLGLTLGFLAIYLTQRAGSSMSAALPLLLFGVPISDILSVLFQRITSGMNWFEATRNHVHHRLLDLGFSHFETVVIIYSIHATLVLSAVLLRFATDAIVTLAFAAPIVMLYATLILAERRGWRAHQRRSSLAAVGVLLRRLRPTQRVRGVSLLLIAVLIPTFTLLVSVWVSTVPRDFGMSACLLLAAAVLALALKSSRGPVLSRATVFATAIFSSYLLIHYPRATPSPVGLLSTSMIVGLAAAVGVYVRFAPDNRFQTTPTDYLIVFGLLTLLVFGLISVNSRSAVDLVVYSTVLLYGCEIMVGQAARHSRIVQFSTLPTLAVLIGRGLF